MRPITMEEVELRRQEILDTIKDPTASHEQKVTYLARHAENFMTVLDEPAELDELMRCEQEVRCICNLFEGDAPYRPRYITPDYPKFLRQGSRFLQLDPPKDLFEVLNSLMILYHNVPSITNYPVFIGDLDQLLEPYCEGLDDETVKKALRLFLIQVDRTILDSFCHANIGPRASRVGLLLMQVESELENAVPNLTMRVAEDTPDDFLLAGIDCALHSAKPSSRYKKTYCCNPFIHAAYAHGAQHPRMLAGCRRASGIGMEKSSFYKFGCWRCVGKPSFSKLQKGDVLVCHSHVAMYIGKKKLVEASGGGWSASSITVRHMSSSRYRGSERRFPKAIRMT